MTDNPAKTNLRMKMRAARAAVPVAEREAGARAVATWLPATPRSVVSAYLAISEELDPAPLLAHLHASGHQLCLPVMVGKDQPLQFRSYAPGDAVVARQWGIQEPHIDKPLLEPNVLLVPLLAVDMAGYRLGYGGGYYDRTLRALRSDTLSRRPVRAIGLAFDIQIIDVVPHLDYDERIDAVLTPSGYRALP